MPGWTVIARAAPPAGTVDSACGTVSGTRFNLEPRQSPVPQDGTSVDFLPGQGVAAGDLVVGAANDLRAFYPVPVPGEFLLFYFETGFYVHRNGSDANPCSPDFEGGLPPITDSSTGDTLVGAGEPAVVADARNNAFFVADIRGDPVEESEDAIALFRATAADLDDSSKCPDGTQTLAESQACWSTSVLLDLSSFYNIFSNLKPSVVVDQRSSGVGAGDVYLSATAEPFSGSQYIFIVACKNDLSACSSPVPVSGSDSKPDASNIAARPDGGVTLTYTVESGGEIEMPSKADIKYVACTPQGAPLPPMCAPASLITTENQAIPFDPLMISPTGLEAARFEMFTFPKHTHRLDQNGIETYVVWDRCKVSTAVTYPGLTLISACPDADLMMAASNDDGATWSFSAVDTGPQDQFEPAITTDTSTNTVNIAYYSSQGDPFQHRSRVLLRQIPPGPSTPDPVTDPVTITSFPMDPSTDPVTQGTFIGFYIGIASRGGLGGSETYIHYMQTAVPGVYHGATDPEQNNHLSRFEY